MSDLAWKHAEVDAWARRARNWGYVYLGLTGMVELGYIGVYYGLE